MSAFIGQAEDLSSLEENFVRRGSSSIQAEDLSSFQGKQKWFVTSNPYAPMPTQHYQHLQTKGYELSTLRSGLTVPVQLFGLDYARQGTLGDAQQQLEEIRREAEAASAIDNDIDPIPDSAYDDADSLLDLLSRYNVPMPDIGWAEDGSLGFEWRPENGIVSMGLYGDNLVIYGAFFDDKRKVEGICTLSDTALLRGFIVTLSSLLV